MKPMQKSLSRPGAVIAAAGVALALTLSGCGGGDEKKTDETAQSEETTAPGAMQGEAAETEESTEAGQSEAAKPEPSKTKYEDPFKDSPKATSWASDDGIKVNEEGDGTVPKASLEADIDDLFKNKFTMKVKAVECRDDMKVMDWWGLTSCEVQTKKKTYFGSVKLVDHKNDMVKYEVKFPGLDPSEVDF
ncbi:hypothetical protein GCM10009689_38060 [Brevibacterium antiquum]|uniref:hypothetical protein n=1 Tax=Brevibacterium antiquum TaxID=234835 RepID=UPI0018DF3364|nr:hypothetical protein [Brevibacterium antiquum]